MSELESPDWGDIRSLRKELNKVKRLLQDIRECLPSEPTPQRRSKRSTIRHATQQDKPPAWAEQIITRFSILEDWIGRIQSQTDDIEAHNRRNGTQQPQVHPADGHYEGSLRSPPPQDSGMASASTHQRREAEPEDQAQANSHGDNSATSVKASRDPSSDGSNEDTPMQDYDEVQPSPPGSTAAAASAASTSQSAPRQATATDSRPDHQHSTPAINPTPDSQSDGSIDQSPTTSGEQEREPGGHDADTLMTDAEQPTCGRQDLAKRAAEATVVMSPQAHEGEGGPEPIVANDQPAESLGPEDSTGRLVSMSTRDGHTATPLPTTQDPASRCASPNGSASNREDTASAQTSIPTPSSDTTPQDRTTQPPATPNPSSQDGDAHLNVQAKSHGTTPQGSDTTEDTSRPTTPDTPLTSPDAAAPDSPSKFTISAADMEEGLVQVLNKYMSDPDFANEVFVPLPGIDPAEIQKGLDVDYTHCRHTGVRFEAGPKGEGYANVFASEG
ncbi:hypothetical protein NW767_015123, partial [Fusarium falciforme]